MHLNLVLTADEKFRFVLGEYPGDLTDGIFGCDGGSREDYEVLSTCLIGNGFEAIDRAAFVSAIMAVVNGAGLVSIPLKGELK
jgi:hypothetical protein